MFVYCLYCGWEGQEFELLETCQGDVCPCCESNTIEYN